MQQLSGRVFIDKVDISMVSLKDLRYQMMYLSKEVCLFDGTLRDNIDPLYKTTDDEVTEIMEKLRFDKNEYKKDGLKMKVE